MNAGKSTLLLQASHNYQERGMKTYLITAQLDNRAGEGQIGSRIGIDASADTFTVDDDLFYKIKLKLSKEKISNNEVEGVSLNDQINLTWSLDDFLIHES